MSYTRIALLLAALLCTGCSSKVDANASDSASDSSSDSASDSASDGVVTTSPTSAPDQPGESASTLQLPRPAEQMAESFRNLFQTDAVYFAGLPTEEGLKQMQAAGVTLVVNLLSEPEVKGSQLDEQALTESLGMTYAHIPVSPATFSRDDVDRFAKAMEGAQGKVLVHCASANRVGAMWASYLILHQGLEKDEALSHGKAAGMTSPALVEAIERVTGS